jgi:hypothetical protein
MWIFSTGGLPRGLAAGAPPDARPGASGYVPVKFVSNTKMREQIRAWRVSAVVAVTKPGTRLARYLTTLLGTPAVVTGDVMAWRTPPSLR